MSQGDGFKHITVTPAEEEDVVIHAGVSASEVEQLDERPLVDAEPVDEGPIDQEPIDTGSSDEKPASVKQRPSRKAKDDEFRETTLEDLEGSSMPFIQKAVIAFCIICIIGAVAYYLAFIR